MSWSLKKIAGAALVSTALVSSVASAQQGPPPQDGGGGDNVPPPVRVPNKFDRTPPPMQGGMQPGHPGGPEQQAQRLQRYLELVERFAQISKDPDTAGIAAVIAMGDVMRPRGPEAIINYFNQLLPKVQSPAVQRAIRLQIGQAYMASGQMDKAIEQYEILVGASAAGGTAAEKK